MTTTATAAYWEPLWAHGRRYRQLDNLETRLLDEQDPAEGARPSTSAAATAP
ncbi:hypothetical protein ACFVRB_42140 [Streptomyces nojiriensis]|uniref:hypothetical protein n=1 Tax=Streptomyces nojiriensis TaxID=66374 RepID=UPI0036DA05EE